LLAKEVTPRMILFSGIAGRARAAPEAPLAALDQLTVLYDADLIDPSESTAIQKVCSIP
jgi:hypothetical protein